MTDITFQSSVAAKGGRAGTHKPQCRRSMSGPSRNYDDTLLLELHWSTLQGPPEWGKEAHAGAAMFLTQ